MEIYEFRFQGRNFQLSYNSKLKQMKNLPRTSCESRFKIEPIMIGKGMNGEIYETNNPKVVVKIVRIFNDDTNFKKEVELTKKVGLENIGPLVYDAFICKNRFQEKAGFLFIERFFNGFNDWYTKFITGNSLKKSKESIESLYQVLLEILKDAHKINIVHYDIFPKNIMFNDEFEPYFIDWTFTEKVGKNEKNEDLNLLQLFKKNLKTLVEFQEKNKDKKILNGKEVQHLLSNNTCIERLYNNADYNNWDEFVKCLRVH